MKRSHLIAIAVLVGVGALFALAIRGDRRGDVVRDPVEAARDRARAQMEAVQRRVEAERGEMQLRQDERATAIAELVAGVRPGQPGPFFDAIHFGSAGLSSSPAELDALAKGSVEHGFTVGVEPRRLRVAIPAAAARAILHEWGDPGSPIRDAASHAELTFDDGDPTTTFTWRPYETIAHLVDPGDDRPLGSTPFSIVGTPLDAVSRALGDHLQRPSAAHPDEYLWTLPPMEDGSVSAEVEVDHGVVARVTIDLLVPPDPVASAIVAAYGDAGAVHLGPWKHGAIVVEIQGHPPDGATVTATRAK